MNEHEVNGYLYREFDVEFGQEIELDVNGQLVHVKNCGPWRITKDHEEEVKLGTEAPREISVHRLEVLQKILAEKRREQ